MLCRQFGCIAVAFVEIIVLDVQGQELRILIELVICVSFFVKLCVSRRVRKIMQKTSFSWELVERLTSVDESKCLNSPKSRVS